MFKWLRHLLWGWGWFFYSPKQEETVLRHYGKTPRFNYCKLLNGQIVRYSEWCNRPKPYGLWEDYQRLGFGRFHHQERVGNYRG